MRQRLPWIARALAPALLAGLASAGAAAADAGPGGKVFLTPEEALALAFPDCAIERQKLVLSEAEEARVEELGAVELEARLVFAYAARRAGELVGTAYFDTHRVRTLRETLMVVVAPDERVGRVEVLAFGEPLEYLPRGAFYAQFRGKGLGDELELDRGVRRVAGATLTARATAAAARRALAIHRVAAERAD